MKTALRFICLIALLWTAMAEAGPIRDRLRERAAARDAEQGGNPSMIVAPGNHEVAFNFNGTRREYLIHVPKSYDPAKPTPLVLFYHGGGGTMEYMADDAHYGVNAKSESAGFIAVYPNGNGALRSGKIATWNAGNCCGGAREKNADDVGFSRAVVERVSKQLSIDPARVYAAGMSNGGMMAYRLACEAPDVFRAVASVTGTDNTRTCPSGTPISVLHIHAENDDHVLFNGGMGPGAKHEDKVTEYTSVPATIAKWTGRDGCPATPTRVFENDGAYCDLYAPCANSTRVKLCVTKTGGHSWPGGGEARSGAMPSQAISANDMIWSFFEGQ